MARILVVDDEESICKALSKRLKKMGHRVAIARDGLEALEHFRPDAFDLIITDYRMPRMDGLELLERVQAQSSSFPVILITGTSTQTREFFLDRGARAYLTKPVTKKDLAAALNQVLDVAGSG